MTLRVRAQGAGLKEPAVLRILANLLTVGQGVTRPFTGQGIGMELCAPMLRLLAGALDVAQAKGLGRRFQLSLNMSGVTPQYKVRRAGLDGPQ